jgi:hypothetical protein
MAPALVAHVAVPPKFTANLKQVESLLPGALPHEALAMASNLHGRRREGHVPMKRCPRLRQRSPCALGIGWTTSRMA